MFFEVATAARRSRAGLPPESRQRYTLSSPGHRMTSPHRPLDPSTEAVLDREAVLYLVALAGSGKVRVALDQLFDLVHQMFGEDDYARCDQLFEILDPERIGLHIAGGLLTVTLRFKLDLPHRGAFAEAAMAAVAKTDPARADRLFRHLL